MDTHDSEYEGFCACYPSVWQTICKIFSVHSSTSMLPHASNFGLRISSLKIVVTFRGPHHLIKGRDNPTSQLLPIMNNKCCSGDGERRKNKGGGGGLRSKTSRMWRVVCDKVACERWCVAKKDAARPTRPSPALLHETNERHHCAMQSALQQSPHASVTRECHKHCQIPNVTKNLNRTETSHVASTHAQKGSTKTYICFLFNL